MTVENRFFTRCVLLIAIATPAASVGQDRVVASARERDLIAVLQSDAPKAEKAITCKHLAIYGSEKAVPVLAPLLGDEDVGSWARIALEAIPGPVADAALRDAMGKLDGRLLIGTINSIGVRRDAHAVDGLVLKLDDANAHVASAAAVALGHIGGEKAAQALARSLADAPAGVRSAAAEGCILCAEWYMAQDRPVEAAKLYDTVRQANVPPERHLEAIRGAILARGSAGLPLLIEQLRSEDGDKVGIGLRAARELRGRAVTEALAAELDRLSPDRRPLLLLALADRGDAAVLPAVLKAAKSGPKNLRITAIGILIRLGDVSCVPSLLEVATEGNAELEQAAIATLVRLLGDDVDADLLARLPQAKGKRRQVLIQLAGQRQIGAALPAVVSGIEDADAGVRGAAIEALGVIGQDQQVASLVGLLQKTDNSKERASIERALLAVCGRSGVTCIPHLRSLTQSSDNDLHMMGLHALAIVGGPDALTAVESAIDSAEPTVQDEAVRILSTWPNNWPEDDDAGQALLALATSAEKMSHQVLGLRGYLQYMRGNKKLSNDEKAARIKALRAQIKRPEEERLAIAVLSDAPSVGALGLLAEVAQDPAVAEEAYSAMVRVASNDVPGLSRQQRRQALETVAEKSRNSDTRQRAGQTLRRIR